MEGAIYAATAVITVAWSVWNYFLWSEKAGLPEESALRFLIIGGPSAYFLLIVLAGWQQVQAVRLDLVGLVAIDAVTILCVLFLLVGMRFRAETRRTVYVWVFTIYNLLGAALTGGVYVVRSSPILLIRLSSVLRGLSEIRLLSFDWIGADTQEQKRDLTSLLNRVLIALISYVPVSAMRFVASSRHRTKVRRELELLRRRVGELEARELARHGDDSSET